MHFVELGIMHFYPAQTKVHLTVTAYMKAQTFPKPSPVIPVVVAAVGVVAAAPLRPPHKEPSPALPHPTLPLGLEELVAGGQLVSSPGAAADGGTCETERIRRGRQYAALSQTLK